MIPAVFANYMPGIKQCIPVPARHTQLYIHAAHLAYNGLGGNGLSAKMDLRLGPISSMYIVREFTSIFYNGLGYHGRILTA